MSTTNSSKPNKFELIKFLVVSSLVVLVVVVAAAAAATNILLLIQTLLLENLLPSEFKLWTLLWSL